MEQHSLEPHRDQPAFITCWGFWALMAGGLAVILVFAQIIGPSFEPKATVGSQIGEIAGEIKRSAWSSLLGLPKAEPEVVATPIWYYFALAAPVLGVCAIILSVISAILKENWRFATYGTALGVAAVVFQLFWWVALVVAGMILLVSIIENLDSIFSF